MPGWGHFDAPKRGLMSTPDVHRPCAVVTLAIDPIAYFEAGQDLGTRMFSQSHGVQNMVKMTMGLKDKVGFNFLNPEPGNGIVTSQKRVDDHIETADFKRERCVPMPRNMNSHR